MPEQEKEEHPSLEPKPTLGQKAADKLTMFCGSWLFIVLLVIIMIIWISINVLLLIFRWDPYPFILLNLILSCLAVIQAPIILMSQNREAQRDRLMAQYDYNVNKKAELEIEDMQKDLHEIKDALSKLSKKRK